MSLQLPSNRNTLSEPKPYSRDASNEDDYQSNSFQIQQDRAWLREQLLAGKNSPLCEPITPAYFDELRARIRRNFANK